METSYGDINPWPHRAAMMLTCATFPLIWVGGLVTTYDAGMAVPDWPTTYGYNLFLYPWKTWFFGPWDLFIEHGHRLLGAAVGLLTIAMLIVAWRFDARRWVTWLAFVALFAVVVQGVLGGARVLADDRTLAQVHGVLGPVFFALATALAVVTSSYWHRGVAERPLNNATGLSRLATVTCGLALVQIALGGFVRHIPVSAATSRFAGSVAVHILMGLIVLVHILVLAARGISTGNRSPLFWPALWLGALGLVQVLLGIATWVTNYGWPSWMRNQTWAAGYTVTASGMVQSMVTTFHQAGGSLILAFAVVISLRAVRSWRYFASLESSGRFVLPGRTAGASA